MKNYFLMLFLGLILQGCLDLRSCDLDKLQGRYYCYNNEKAINWLDIKKDGTFIHYYKEDTIQLSHHGTWKKDKDCVIELFKWKTFNQSGNNYELYNSKYLWVTSNQYLDIGPDGNSDTSFEKSDEDISVNPLQRQ